MKFDKQRFPILEAINDWSVANFNPDHFGFNEDSHLEIKNFIRSILIENDIMYFSENVEKYIKDDVFGLRKQLYELLDTNLDSRGIILKKDGITYIYSVGREDGALHFNIFCYADGVLWTTVFGKYIDRETDIQFDTRYNSTIEFDETDLRTPAMRMISEIFTKVIFKEFAPIETLVVNKSKQRRGKLNKERYVNDLNSDVTVIDSTWFTNIVRTEGFGVRGHFRLQPCGVGLKDRKLIWVDAFQKNGYKRTAKKLAE